MNLPTRTFTFPNEKSPVIATFANAAHDATVDHGPDQRTILLSEWETAPDQGSPSEAEMRGV
jgi:hypothetical protein